MQDLQDPEANCRVKKQWSYTRLVKSGARPIVKRWKRLAMESRWRPTTGLRDYRCTSRDPRPETSRRRCRLRELWNGNDWVSRASGITELPDFPWYNIPKRGGGGKYQHFKSSQMGIFGMQI
jgi:hypothetical protein